jgi:hypothetical protein
MTIRPKALGRTLIASRGQVSASARYPELVRTNDMNACLAHVVTKLGAHACHGSHACPPGSRRRRHLTVRG